MDGMSYEVRAHNAETALAQAQARIAELYELLGESGMELARCKIFVGSREKMHPDGLTLYQELLDRIDAAVEKGIKP